jgi:hypothetical protein
MEFLLLDEAWQVFRLHDKKQIGQMKKTIADGKLETIM